LLVIKDWQLFYPTYKIISPSNQFSWSRTWRMFPNFQNLHWRKSFWLVEDQWISISKSFESYTTYSINSCNEYCNRTGAILCRKARHNASMFSWRRNSLLNLFHSSEPESCTRIQLGLFVEILWNEYLDQQIISHIASLVLFDYLFGHYSKYLNIYLILKRFGYIQLVHSFFIITSLFNCFQCISYHRSPSKFNCTVLWKDRESRILWIQVLSELWARHSLSFLKIIKKNPLWSEKTGHHLLQNSLDQNSIKNYHYCIVQFFECQLFLKLDYCWFWTNFKIGSEIFVLQFVIGDHSRTKKFFSCRILFDLNIVKISCVHPRSKCNNLKKSNYCLFYEHSHKRTKFIGHTLRREMRSSLLS
jgi:hypothetical protein